MRPGRGGRRRAAAGSTPHASALPPASPHAAGRGLRRGRAAAAPPPPCAAGSPPRCAREQHSQRAHLCLLPWRGAGWHVQRGQQRAPARAAGAAAGSGGGGWGGGGLECQPTRPPVAGVRVCAQGGGRRESKGTITNLHFCAWARRLGDKLVVGGGGDPGSGGSGGCTPCCALRQRLACCALHFLQFGLVQQPNCRLHPAVLPGPHHAKRE